MTTNPTTLSEVLAAEDELLRERRAKIMGDEFAEQLEDNRFGIALSGGGIRSATINLGILRTLSKFGLLKQADYLSTVSGGGYTGAYIQSTMRAEEGEDGLFDDAHIDYMRKRGEYLSPGTGWYKIWNQVTLVVAFLVSFVMSLVSPAVLITLIFGSYAFVSYYGAVTPELSFTSLASDHWQWLLTEFGYGFLAVLVMHYVLNVSQTYDLYKSHTLNRVEAAVLIVAAASFLWPLIKSFQNISFPDDTYLIAFPTAGLFLVILGFFTNPNATSFHRFYRKQLSDAFLHFTGENKNVLLHRLCDVNSKQACNYQAPYPLINTCLNLQSSSDKNFQGAKASDYFLLSPLYCGAKLVGYVPTASTRGYNQLTLPAATTISAAALNPGLGSYSNKVLSIFLTIFNLRLGFWTWNPMKMNTNWPVVWWPFYFFYELLGRIGTDKKMINISDGAHIENLGVMELFRRRCRLILAVDAGADPSYIFSDLENLTIRARNELGIDIRFRPDQVPEDVMRVNPSHGYSRQRFAVADLYRLWDKMTDENGEEQIVHYPDGRKEGIFVYVKSAIVAPTGRPQISKKEEPLKYGTYKYKIYNPDFPHESTADQFFDPIQWESYFQLGQFMAADVLGCDNLNEFDVDHAFTIPMHEFYDRFDLGTQLFGSVKLPPPIAARSRSLEEVVVKAVIEQVPEEEIPTDYQM